MAEIRSSDWSEFTGADYNQIVDQYNNLLSYVNELLPLSNIALRSALDLETMRDVGLNAIQITDPDIISSFNVLYRTAADLGRDTVLALGSLKASLIELEGTLSLVAGLISMGPNPFS